MNKNQKNQTVGTTKVGTTLLGTKVEPAKAVKPKAPKVAVKKYESCPETYDFTTQKALRRKNFTCAADYFQHSSQMYAWKSQVALAKAAELREKGDPKIARTERQLKKTMEKMELLKKTLAESGVDVAALLLAAQAAAVANKK